MAKVTAKQGAAGVLVISLLGGGTWGTPQVLAAAEKVQQVLTITDDVAEIKKAQDDQVKHNAAQAVQQAKVIQEQAVQAERINGIDGKMDLIIQMIESGR